MATIDLNRAHALPMAALIASALLHHVYMHFMVIRGRFRFKIRYPDMYATPETCFDEKARLHFNCIQRAHQNSLENQPIFLFLLSASGLRYPTAAGVLGFGYLLGRLVYFVGYASGKPKGRMTGVYLQSLCIIGLLGLAVSFCIMLTKA